MNIDISLFIRIMHKILLPTWFYALIISNSYLLVYCFAVHSVSVNSFVMCSGNLIVFALISSIPVILR